MFSFFFLGTDAFNGFQQLYKCKKSSEIGVLGRAYDVHATVGIAR